MVFDPTTIPTCTAYYGPLTGSYSDLGITPCVDGSTMEQGNNGGSSAIPFLQLTSGARPTYHTNLLNGQPGLLFSGAQSLSVAALLSSAYNTAITAFILYQDTSTTNSFPGGLSAGGAGSNYLYLGRNGNDISHLSQQTLQTAHGLTGSNLLQTMSVGGNRLNCQAMRYDGTTYTMYENGAKVSKSLPGSLGVSGSLYVGQDSTGTYLLTGYVYYVLVYNRALTDLEMTTVFAGIQSIFGVPVTPPVNRFVASCNSLSYGVPYTPGSGLDYPAQLLALLGPSWESVNLGVSGKTTSQFLSSFSTLEATASSVSHITDVLFAWEVSNSIVAGLTADQIIKGDGTGVFEQVCTAAKAAGFTVYAMTCIPRVGITAGALETIRTTVNARMIADTSGTYWNSKVIDVASSPYLNDYTNHTYFQAGDQTHLTGTGGVTGGGGYGVVASILYPFLVPYLPILPDMQNWQPSPERREVIAVS